MSSSATQPNLSASVVGCGIEPEIERPGADCSVTKSSNGGNLEASKADLIRKMRGDTITQYAIRPGG